MTDDTKRAKRKRYPKHASTIQVVEAALEVSDVLSHKMHGWLDALHALREMLREERVQDRAVGRVVRAQNKKHTYLTKNDQYRTISLLVTKDARYANIHSQVLQNVADQIDRGTKAWLSGKRKPLKFSPRKKYRSFNFTQYGYAVKITNGRLHMSKLGEARLIGLRRLPGRIKSVNVVFKQGRWFAQFTCEIQLQHSERARRNASTEVSALPDTGLDTGLKMTATLADGTAFKPAKPLRDALPALKKAQQKMARQFKVRKALFKEKAKTFAEADLCGPPQPYERFPYSNRLKRQIKAVAVLHTKVANTRRDQIRKVANRIEMTYRMVAVEEHGIRFMQRNRRTSRAASDVAPAMFKQTLKHKLGEDRYLGVPNRRPGIGGNSQTCLCGEPVPKTLKDRWHECPACGLSADRDTVSANIAMMIGFGYCHLQRTGPGQGLKRGESECLTGQPVAAPQATELSVKRKSSSNSSVTRKTAGAKATAEANNPSVLRSAPAPSLTG